MAVGAYTGAALSVYGSAPLLADLQAWFPVAVARALYFPIPLVVGGLAASLAGLLVGIPALRLRGDYLAIATLGFGEIIRIAILNIDAVGGARGFSLTAQAGVDLRYESLGAIGAVVAISVALIARLVYSTGGLAFRAVREDEIAAEAMGIATTRVKVEAFAIASFFAGVAGALFAHAEGYVHTNSFSFVRSFEIMAFVVLGGLGSLTGAARRGRGADRGPRAAARTRRVAHGALLAADHRDDAGPAAGAVRIARALAELPVAPTRRARRSRDGAARARRHHRSLRRRRRDLEARSPRGRAANSSR